MRACPSHPDRIFPSSGPACSVLHVDPACIRPTANATEAVLAAHEQELARLRQQYLAMEPMLEMIGKHVAMLKQIVDFLIESTHKDRLTSRGGNSGRLLREEKFRAAMPRDVPKVRSTFTPPAFEHGAHAGRTEPPCVSRLKRSSRWRCASGRPRTAGRSWLTAGATWTACTARRRWPA